MTKTFRISLVTATLLGFGFALAATPAAAGEATIFSGPFNGAHVGGSGGPMPVTGGGGGSGGFLSGNPGATPLDLGSSQFSNTGILPGGGGRGGSIAGSLSGGGGVGGGK